jgi:hypothetical protein
MMRSNRQTGANVLEMAALLFAIIGAVIGASFGYARMGAWGVVLGIPGGALLALVFIGFMIAILGVMLEAVFGVRLIPPRKPKE